MANIKFTNFARSKLTVGISTGATTITITGASGALFPALTAGEYFYATLENAALAREIVKVTARTGDSLTVTRAQDNTTALAWNAGDVFALRFNAKAISDVLDSSAQQSGLTGTLFTPSGTTAERFAAIGIRYNTDEARFEGYNGAAWGGIGGGATGAPGNAVFIENDKVVTGDYTITTGKHAGSFGRITIADGVTVTIPDDTDWVIAG